MKAAPRALGVTYAPTLVFFGDAGTEVFRIDAYLRPRAASPSSRDSGTAPTERIPLSATEAPIRVLIAKVGLDGHDRGVKIVARALRDAGMDVIYTGLHRTPEEVAEAAIQEDVDVVGISILSGAHMTVFPRVIRILAERKASDILVIGGGVIPDEDVAVLKAQGVSELMLQDTPPDAIVAMVRRLVAERPPR